MDRLLEPVQAHDHRDVGVVAVACGDCLGDHASADAGFPPLDLDEPALAVQGCDDVRTAVARGSGEPYGFVAAGDQESHHGAFECLPASTAEQEICNDPL